MFSSGAISEAEGKANAALEVPCRAIAQAARFRTMVLSMTMTAWQSGVPLHGYLRRICEESSSA